MAEKVTKSMKVSASGMLNIEDGGIFIEVEDVGTFDLKKLLADFNGRTIKLSCSYDKEQDTPNIDEETGELLD